MPCLSVVDTRMVFQLSVDLVPMSYLATKPKREVKVHMANNTTVNNRKKMLSSINWLLCSIFAKVRPPPPPIDIRDLLSWGYKMPLRRARPGEKPDKKKRNRLTGRAAGQHTSYFADPSPPSGQGTAPTI